MLLIILINTEFWVGGLQKRRFSMEKKDLTVEYFATGEKKNEIQNIFPFHLRTFVWRKYSISHCCGWMETKHVGGDNSLGYFWVGDSIGYPEPNLLPLFIVRLLRGAGRGGGVRYAKACK